jgi:FkbM family methyltransferase
MRYFIDIGTYNGELLEEVICKLPSFDRYIGFEPVPSMCEESKARFKNNKKVKINQLAISTSFKKNIKFYVSYCKEKGGCTGEGTEVGTGSTLLKKKQTGMIDKTVFIKVKTIDLARYIMSNFKKEDYIVLKIDVEGKEYDIFEHMIQTGAIKYINKLYCEWHIAKFNTDGRINRRRHNKVVEKLIKNGIDITGDNHYDEISSTLKNMDEICPQE